MPEDRPGVPGRGRRPSRRGPPGSRDVGIESADDGWASTLFSDASAAAVYWTIISPLFRPGSGRQERRQAAVEPRRRASSAVRRSEIEPSSASASFAKSSASAIGSPWKLPPRDHQAAAGRERVGRRRTPPRGNTSGLSVAELSSMSRTRRRWSSASRTAPWTWGTQRSEYGSWTLCADAVVRPLEARAAQQVAQLGRRPRSGPGAAGRAGTARRTRPRCPSSASTRHRRRDRRRARRAGRRRRASSAPSALISWVPLSSARPSLGSSVSGSRPARASATSAGTTCAVDLDLAAPDERQREVRERREVAGRARRSPAPARPGGCPRARKLADPVDEQRPAARVPERERVRPQQQHRAHDLARERPADARGVARR